jgi:hypothetical protein
VRPVRALLSILLVLGALIGGSAPAFGRPAGAEPVLGLSASTTTPAPGETLTAFGTGCVIEVGAVAGLSLLRDGTFLDGGIVTPAADGSFSRTLVVPADTPVGTELVVYAVCGDGDVVAADAELALVVSAPPEPPSSSTVVVDPADTDAAASPRFTG